MHRISWQLSPGRARSAYNLAVSLQTASQWSEAEALYRTAIALAATPSGGMLEVANAYSNLGVTLQALSRLAEAAEAFRAALALAPAHRSASYNLCNLQLAIATPADSASCFESLLSRNPDDVDVAAAAAGVFHLDGQLERAAALYMRTLQVMCTCRN